MYKISKSYITKIIFDYQLFDLFENDYISPAGLNSSRPTELKPTKFREEEATEYVAENPKTKRTEEKKTVLNAKENTASTTKNNSKQCQIYDENRAKNDEANSFSDAKKHENRKKTLEQSHFPTLARAANSLIINDLRKTKTGIKENIRDIITTTTEKEKEKEPAVVVDDDADKKFWGNAEKVFVDAENSFEETCLSQFKQAVCENGFAAFVADETQNSGNCKHLGFLPPNEVYETGLCNFHRIADCGNTIRWAYCAFLPVVACCKPTVDSLCKPTPQLGKCHT